MEEAGELFSALDQGRQAGSGDTSNIVLEMGDVCYSSGVAMAAYGIRRSDIACVLRDRINIDKM